MFLIPKSSTITLRLPLEFIKAIHHYSEVLRLKPSVLASMILQDDLETWVKNYAKTVYKEVLEE